MKLAWLKPSNEIAVAGTRDALRELVAAADDNSGVAWWIADQNVPTMDEACSHLAFLGAHGTSPYAFAPMQLQQRLTIERVWLDNTDVELLIANVNLDLYSRYPEPGALIFSLVSADIVDGVGTLLMAELDGEPVGCGAFRVMDDVPGSAEIKRIYVTLSGRGKKIGAAILVELERAAEAIGVRRFALETGPRQPEVQRMYERAGYVVCDSWGHFVGKEFSICMEKVASLG